MIVQQDSSEDGPTSSCSVALLIQRNQGAAKAAGLRYVLDHAPGIRRRRRGSNFVYELPNGQLVKDAATLQRIRSLVIPPAWEEVWICAHARGHLQATGRDQRGRKQYRYHNDWRVTRDDHKYHRLIRFAEALPGIRQRVAADLRRRGLPKEKVVAGIVKLLELTLIRIGNEEYARLNSSYGLTTLRNRHVHVQGKTIGFHFRGKSGIAHQITLRHPRLAALVRECRKLPGKDVFQYLDDDGRVRDIKSADVNAYLKSVTGESFTAKDFRTWSGTVLALQKLRGCGEFTSVSVARKTITQVVQVVAERLGNTSAVCRKCYIMPAVFDAYLERRLTVLTVTTKRRRPRSSALCQLTDDECEVLTLLKSRYGQRRQRQRTQTASA
ncbi:MAG TPA: DNA topoisomerase IB [Planctomycetaceae bacterium]|nr:DNA topoisomerase IB [Planctomycetaceae bacterium]